MDFLEKIKNLISLINETEFNKDENLTNLLNDINNELENQIKTKEEENKDITNSQLLDTYDKTSEELANTDLETENKE